MWGRGEFDLSGHYLTSVLIKFASSQEPPGKSKNYPF